MFTNLVKLTNKLGSYKLRKLLVYIGSSYFQVLMQFSTCRIPITVYMRDTNSSSLRIIAEYGQEYGKDNPIRVLYHGYGHYDALRCPVTGAPSKL